MIMMLTTDLATLAAWWSDKLSTQSEIFTASGIKNVWWQYALVDLGTENGESAVVQEAAEIDQSIKIILQTHYGQDIHRPTFASNLLPFIDYPIPEAAIHLVRESILAIERWEPRVKIINLTTKQYDPGISGLTIIVEWQLETLVQRTEISVVGG